MYTNSPQRSYTQYKDLLPKIEGYRNDVRDKEVQINQMTAQIAELNRQLATTKASQSNGVDTAAGGDSAYWKQKYETLLSNV